MKNSTCDIHALLPTHERRWYIFLLISACAWAAGIIAILLGRLLIRLTAKSKSRKHQRRGLYLTIVNYAGNMQSGRNIPGKILVTISFLANMLAFAIYLVHTEKYPVEYCVDLTEDYDFIVTEIVLYIFFLIHFLVRFLAATDKLIFWTWDIYTYIDLLTFPLVFHSYTQNSAWLGLRFLRIIYIHCLPLVLTYLNVLKIGPNYEMGVILGKFLALLLTSAGMIHLLENTGDFWNDINYSNNRFAVYKKPLNYFDCVYFMVVTLSTVGYGDISCGTYLGRIFSILIIMFGLGLFATYVPVIFEFITSHTKYNQSFSTTTGKRHVVVTGHVTDETVKSFVQDFLHPDRQNNNTNIVFLATKQPTVVVQAILHQWHRKVSYFTGTVYKHEDCERVKMSESSALIVLCNKKSANPEAEDAGNITRVILLKKFYRKIRCIVQLIRRESKYHIFNCPQWRMNRDSIVCIDELKLGFMAQSCNAPGFSTLLANMFIMRTADDEKDREIDQWRTSYLHGVSCELYSTKLSDFFIGMSFPKVTEICFEKLQIMLLAVEVEQNGKNVLLVNPSAELLITKNAIGFFCAQEFAGVDRARTYHGDGDDDDDDGKLEVKVLSTSCLSAPPSYSDSDDTFDSDSKVRMNSTSFTKLDTCGSPDSVNSSTNLTFSSDETVTKGRRRVSRLEKTKSVVMEKDALFDQTGTYFWCARRPFMKSIMSLDEAESRKFVGHVVILVISDGRAPSLGLRQLVQPLRASNQPADELKKIIVLGNIEFLAREWNTIGNFPDVHIVEGSPYSRVDLRAINVHTADMCILLSPRQNSFMEGVEHEAVSDKEVIMVTLNLRAMTFEKHHNHMQLNRDCATPLMGSSPIFEHVFKTANPENTKLQQEIHSVSGENITLITELVYDSNTLYMDDEIKSERCEDGIYMTQSYACGSVFTVSMLDFLASATYFNKHVLKLVHSLVTGSVNPKLETILLESREPSGTRENEEIASVRNRCRVDQLSLSDPLFADLGRINEFGELFLKSMKTHNILCLGLYRLHTTHTVSLQCLSTRYVITFPPSNMTLENTDLIFVLIPFHSSPNHTYFDHS